MHTQGLRCPAQPADNPRETCAFIGCGRQIYVTNSNAQVLRLASGVALSVTQGVLLANTDCCSVTVRADDSGSSATTARWQDIDTSTTTLSLIEKEIDSMRIFGS